MVVGNESRRTGGTAWARKREVEVIKKRPTEVEQEPTIFTRKVNGNGTGAAIGRRFGRNGIMHAQSDASTGESS